MSIDNIMIVNCRSYDVRYAPLFEIFLASELKKKLGIDSKIFTVFDVQSPDFLLDNIKGENDLIVFWESFSTKAPGYLHKYFEVAEFLKKSVANPLVFGGFWPTTHGRYFKEFDVFDHLLEGYCIERIVKKIEKYKSTSPKHLDVRGIVDWDEYDFTLEFLYDKQCYFSENIFWGYMSSFSCNRNCKFCYANSARNDGSPFSARSARRVKEDIDMIYKAYEGIKSIVIKDLNFFHNISRAFEILEYIKMKGLRTAINVDVTIYQLKKDLLKRLSKLDVTPELFFGLESYDEGTRKKLGKSFSSERLESTFEIMSKYSVNLTGNVMLGLPWQDRQEVEDTISKTLSYMQKYRNLYITMNVYKPEYGTDLQREYFPDLHEKLKFSDLIEIYKNNVSKYQELIFGKEFNFVDLEKAHNCNRLVNAAKRAELETKSKLVETVLLYIRILYERQLRPPYFRSSLLSLTLQKTRTEVVESWLFRISRHDLSSGLRLLVRKAIEMIQRKAYSADWR